MARPYPDEKMIQKVGKYRAKGLSYREIAKLLEKPLKSVHKWGVLSVHHLSTDEPIAKKKR